MTELWICLTSITIPRHSNLPGGSPQPTDALHVRKKLQPCGGKYQKFCFFCKEINNNWFQKTTLITRCGKSSSTLLPVDEMFSRSSLQEYACRELPWSVFLTENSLYTTWLTPFCMGLLMDRVRGWRNAPDGDSWLKLKLIIRVCVV